MSHTHVVNFSGGVCSFWAAHRVVEKHGRLGVFLLFADVLIEDEELYEFNEQCSKILDVPITRVSREMEPWELFRKEGLIGNTRFPICSVRLKREPLDEWHRQNCLEMASTIYLGFDWSEHHRLDDIRAEHPNWHFEAPMCEPPLWDKCRMFEECEKLGIKIPRLYTLGFPHNNCGGRCVRAGISHWVQLLRLLPERYADWERKELATIADFNARGVSSAGFTILRDRRGGTTKPMTLETLRKRVEAGEQFPTDEWGGCGCGGATIPKVA